jgi:hypothetical protein
MGGHCSRECVVKILNYRHSGARASAKLGIGAPDDLENSGLACFTSAPR